MQNVTGFEEDPEAVLLWLYSDFIRAQSGAAAWVSVLSGEDYFETKLELKQD